MRNRLLFGRDREYDGLYLGLALALSFLGVALIFSARQSLDGSTVYYLRQLMWVGLSLIVFLAVIRIPLRVYEVFAYPIFALAIVLLVAVLFFGKGAGGAVRWLNFGAFKFQPSEWAKVAVVIAGARFLSSNRPHPPWFKLLILGLICGIPALLVLREPDLGTAMVFGAIFVGLAFWSRIPMWSLALLLTPLVSLIAASNVYAWLVYLVILLIALAVIRPGLWPAIGMATMNIAAGISTPFLWNKLHHYQQMRILSFLDPSRDPHGAGYQIIQSKVAIGAGGIFGRGYLEGTQTHLKFLPAQHTDFIFAVLGEEFGLLGTTITLSLFAFLVVRGYWFAQRTRNRFGSHIAAGLTSVLLFHILVNIGMTLGAFPVTGLPLPFLSYGGTFLVAIWAQIAMIQVVAERWREY